MQTSHWPQNLGKICVGAKVVSSPIKKWFQCIQHHILQKYHLFIILTLTMINFNLLQKEHVQILEIIALCIHSALSFVHKLIKQNQYNGLRHEMNDS